MRTLAELQARQLDLEDAGERFSPEWCDLANRIALALAKPTDRAPMEAALRSPP